MAKKKIKKKIFSIIIRGNNKAHWLKILLKKIFSQTNKNFEIIFGDNNSNDETLSLLKNYKIKKIIKFHNYRPGFVLNKCVKSSSGKYIIFISSHCVPFNNYWLEDFLTFMEKNSDIVAASGKQLPLPGTSSKDQLDLSILFRDEEIISRKDSYLNNANAKLILRYLKLVGGDVSSSSFPDDLGGSILIHENGGELNLYSSIVFNNKAYSGGGIFTQGASSTNKNAIMNIYNSIIHNYLSKFSL